MTIYFRTSVLTKNQSRTFRAYLLNRSNMQMANLQSKLHITFIIFFLISAHRCFRPAWSSQFYNTLTRTEGKYRYNRTLYRNLDRIYRGLAPLQCLQWSQSVIVVWYLPYRTMVRSEKPCWKRVRPQVAELTEGYLLLNFLSRSVNLNILPVVS